ncbi:MAG: hypothetical protein ACO1OB_25540, partial [Archangium sp.]
MRRRFVLLFISFFACTKPASVTVVDSGVALIAASDGGARVTAEKLDAWLRWQNAVFALPARDGGFDVRQRAKDEARLLSEVGL